MNLTMMLKMITQHSCKFFKKKTNKQYEYNSFYLTSRSQFNELFENFDFESIRKKILTRQMTTSPFTSVLWRIFLHCLPRDSSQWEQTINTEREKYDEYADKYLLDLKKIREYNGDSKDLNHPLSQEDNVNNRFAILFF